MKKILISLEEKDYPTREHLKYELRFQVLEQTDDLRCSDDEPHTKEWKKKEFMPIVSCSHPHISNYISEKIPYWIVFIRGSNVANDFNIVTLQYATKKQRAGMKTQILKAFRQWAKDGYFNHESVNPPYLFEAKERRKNRYYF